jgi:putative transposase
MIVSDNGTELTSSAILSWQQEHDVEWHYIAPESRPIIEEGRIDYNTNRPHSSLNGLTPTEFAARPDQGDNRLLMNEGKSESRSAATLLRSAAF